MGGTGGPAGSDGLDAATDGAAAGVAGLADSAGAAWAAVASDGVDTGAGLEACAGFTSPSPVFGAGVTAGTGSARSGFGSLAVEP